jgi:hypothetical protein
MNNSNGLPELQAMTNRERAKARETLAAYVKATGEELRQGDATSAWKATGLSLFRALMGDSRPMNVVGHLIGVTAEASTQLAQSVTPTPIMVKMYPDFWIAGPGYEVARRVQCEDGYYLTDSCPGCDARYEGLDGVLRALVPDVEITTNPDDVHSVNLPNGGCIEFGETTGLGGRDYGFVVYDADDDMFTTDGGNEDDMYRVAREIAAWVTGKRKGRRRG